VLVGAALYDPGSGIAIFGLPDSVPRLRAGRRDAAAMASDFQESKNVNTTGANIMPNTTFEPWPLRVVNRPTLDWVTPEQTQCVERAQRLVVVAGSTRPIRAVRFYDGARLVSTVRSGAAGLYGTTWRTAGAAKGRHVLRAVAVDAAGRQVAKARPVRVCR
jgi:hypothetical protein